MLLEAGPLHQISCDLSRLHLGHIPGHHFAAPDVDHQIEVEPHTAHRGRQVGDVPAPHLVGAIRPETRHRARFLRQPGPPAAVALTRLVQHPIETALRANKELLIGQCRHDLPRRQRGVLRLVASQQDSLALLLAQLVRDQAVTAFTTIVAVTITDQVLPPPFERPQTDPDLAAGANQARTSGIGLADQFDRLLSVRGAGQPSASSEQKASHFFRSTSKAAISAMAFSLRCSSFLRALISRWSWARSFSSSFCSFKVSTVFSLASWAACRQRSTCSGYRPRSRQ